MKEYRPAITLELYFYQKGWTVRKMTEKVQETNLWRCAPGSISSPEWRRVNVGASDGHVVLSIHNDDEARVRSVDRSGIDENMEDECDEGGREMIDLQAVVPRIAGLTK
jgi:hypothetical protein